MKRFVFAMLCTLTLLAPSFAAQTMICTLQGLKDSITFSIPKAENLPELNFPYAVKPILFVLREGNLLLVAMDQEEKSRLRIFISAQSSKENSVYEGQFMTDFGGNQRQIDNGVASCRLE